jgi:hypothetical protein
MAAPAVVCAHIAAASAAPANTVVPAGFYLKSPGVAAPCPKGEYKVGLASDGACVKCAPGVSTAAIAATGPRECKLVTPGYYPSAFNGDGSVNTTTICPQVGAGRVTSCRTRASLNLIHILPPVSNHTPYSLIPCFCPNHRAATALATLPRRPQQMPAGA